eukprot:g4370.t1
MTGSEPMAPIRLSPSVSKKRELDRGNGISPLERSLRQLLAGAIAGAVTKTSVAPLERVKILFQIQGMTSVAKDKANRKYTGLFQASRLVFKEEGFLSFYKGNGANVMRVIPVYALKFSCNDKFKEMVAREGQDEKDLSVLQRMFAGTMAGLCQQLVTYPLELVRTRLSLGPGMGLQYSGILDCLKRTVNAEGASALYKGLGPTLLTGAPYVGLQMTFYDVYRQALDGDSTLTKLASGAMAGITAQTITYPGDTIKRRMQSNGMGGAKRIYTNSWHCTECIFEKEGIVGFYRGLPINCVRAIPGAAIQFAAYDAAKSLLGV